MRIVTNTQIYTYTYLHILIYPLERVTIKSLLKWSRNTENISWAPDLLEFILMRKYHPFLYRITEHSISGSTTLYNFWSCLKVLGHWHNQYLKAQWCHIILTQLHKHGDQITSSRILALILMSSVFNMHHFISVLEKEESPGNKFIFRF